MDMDDAAADADMDGCNEDGEDSDGGDGYDMGDIDDEITKTVLQKVSRCSSSSKVSRKCKAAH